MTFNADQLDIVDTPQRFFMMDARMKGLPVDVLHVFDSDGATMRVRLLSVRSIVDAKGAVLTHAETVTLFNDICCYAPGALLSPDITWEPIDDHSATAHYALGANTITAELRFDDSGIWRISSPTAGEPCPPTAVPSRRCAGQRRCVTTRRSARHGWRRKPS